MDFFTYFSSMKWISKIIFSVLVCLLLGACSSPQKESTLKILKKHHYNFSHFKKVNHKGLNVKIPAYFEEELGKYHLLQQDALSLSNEELGMFFSIEHFSPSKTEDIVAGFEEGTKPLDAVNTRYADLRANSLRKAKVSMLRDNFNTAPLIGFYQYIQGKSKEDYNSDLELMYMFSTVEKKINGEMHYFVIQLIAPPDVSKYLNDDFLRLIHSAH